VPLPVEPMVLPRSLFCHSALRAVRSVWEGGEFEGGLSLGEEFQAGRVSLNEPSRAGSFKAPYPGNFFLTRERFRPEGLNPKSVGAGRGSLKVTFSGPDGGGFSFAKAIPRRGGFRRSPRFTWFPVAPIPWGMSLIAKLCSPFGLTLRGRFAGRKLEGEPSFGFPPTGRNCEQS